MRTLPDNPSLDHLRQQAKDLLAGLRDCDPDASLSAAQASLAQQYGFRSWTELKAEVDRISPWHAARLSPVSWADLAAEAGARGAGWADTLAAAVPALVDLDTIGQAAPTSPPVLLDISAFSGAASSMGNYVYEEVRLALDAADAEQRHHAERSVRQVLTRLPSRSMFERILDAVDF